MEEIGSGLWDGTQNDVQAEIASRCEDLTLSLFLSLSFFLSPCASPSPLLLPCPLLSSLALAFIVLMFSSNERSLASDTNILDALSNIRK